MNWKQRYAKEDQTTYNCMGCGMHFPSREELDAHTQSGKCAVNLKKIDFKGGAKKKRPRLPGYTPPWIDGINSYSDVSQLDTDLSTAFKDLREYTGRVPDESQQDPTKMSSLHHSIIVAADRRHAFEQAIQAGKSQQNFDYNDISKSHRGQKAAWDAKKPQQGSFFQ